MLSVIEFIIVDSRNYQKAEKAAEMCHSRQTRLNQDSQIGGRKA